MGGRTTASAKPVSTIAAMLGVSRATVYRVLADQDARAEEPRQDCAELEGAEGKLNDPPAPAAN
ncbi:MAG: helix-turn-helix domain-containing protein [Mycobacterium sp.]